MNRYVPSLLLLIVGFGLDRLHKAVQISADCVGLGQSLCVGDAFQFVPATMQDWRGGEVVPVTPFFDYILVWNTGISYSLFSALPVWALGVVTATAVVALSIWWWRAHSRLVRAGLALAIGGALSNIVDRWLYGAVADFFHFHIGQASFYIFNLADTAITVGVGLLILDFVGVGHRRSLA